jgi:hypothetical protein
MMKNIALLAALTLAACQQSPPRTTPAEQHVRLDSGQVAIVATAPDGTKLWAVRAGRRIVYFASSGTATSHVENCGKNCSKTVDDQIPTAQTVDEKIKP